MTNDPATIHIHIAASLLWSWLCEARREWAFESDCLLALQTFRLENLPPIPGGGSWTGPRRKLCEEEALAAFSLAVLQGLIAVGDQRAADLFYKSFGYAPPDDAVIVRPRTQNYP